MNHDMNYLEKICSKANIIFSNNKSYIFLFKGEPYRLFCSSKDNEYMLIREIYKKNVNGATITFDSLTSKSLLEAIELIPISEIHDF